MSWVNPRTWAVFEATTASKMNEISSALNALAPTGMYQYMHHAATRVETVINGAWLECNGAGVSTTTYATLFALVGYSYGGAGATFNLPDFAGRSPVGLSGTGGHADVTALGSSEGAALAARRQKHKHVVNDPTHVHGGIPALSSTDNGGAGAGNVSGTTNSSAASTGISVGPQTGNEPTDAPAYLVGGIWIIKF